MSKLFIGKAEYNLALHLPNHELLPVRTHPKNMLAAAHESDSEKRQHVIPGKPAGKGTPARKNM
jgi:hypothetical protein